MIVMPIVSENHTADMLLIVLNKSNIERMQNADPVQIELGKMGCAKDLKNPIVGIFYEDDLTEFHRLVNANDIRKLLTYLTRGFKFRPDLGDNDEAILLAEGGV